MGGEDLKVITHQLNIDSSFQLIKQKRRKLGVDRNNVMNEEVKQLMENKMICEVQYPERLVNPVVVPKKNRKMKDSFPLPYIDQIIDVIVGHELLSFLDTFSGYNQILMHPNDEEKT